MATLRLIADPTFKAKVPIPIPGSEPVEVEFEFKHRTQSELTKFMEAAKDRADVENIMGAVVGWDFTDKFNKDNVRRLLENYLGASRAISATYFRELMGLRQGN